MGEERSGSIPRLRIQTLSDLIFGLALSLGALTLIGQQSTTFQHLLVSLGCYAFSFLIIIRVWRLYSSIMSVLPVETSGLINLNILLLFLVSIEPFLFYQLFVVTGETWSNVSIIYALDLAAMLLILAFFDNSLASEEKKLAPKRLLKEYGFRRNLLLVMTAIFIISTAPIFQSINVLHFEIGKTSYDITLRITLWFVALLLSLGGDRLRHLLKRATNS